MNENKLVAEIQQIIADSTSGAQLSRLLEDYHDNDIAKAVETLETEERQRLYRALDSQRLSDIFAYLDSAADYFEELGAEKAADILELMDADDAVDILEEVSEEEREDLISRMEEEAEKDVRLIYSYDEDEIGSRMTTNFISVKRGSTIKQAMRTLIAEAEENDNINTIYVEETDGGYYGAIELKDLIVSRDYINLEDIISTSYPHLQATEMVADCIERLKDYEEDSIPVLDENNRIIGVITSADIVEAVDDEMSDDYAKLAGLTAEEDLNESLKESMKKRMPWLILLLFLALGVSSVVGVFEDVVSRFALLVCFQSLILGMAGNVGTQSLAVTIRVLMDENISAKQKIAFVFKEMRVSFTNGIILGIFAFACIGMYVTTAKHLSASYAFAVSGCVGISLVVAMLIAGMVGTLVPMLFHKLKIDPAVASGPLISTVNDLVAVITYYGISGFVLIRLLGI